MGDPYGQLEEAVFFLTEACKVSKDINLVNAAAALDAYTDLVVANPASTSTTATPPPSTSKKRKRKKRPLNFTCKETLLKIVPRSRMTAAMIPLLDDNGVTGDVRWESFVKFNDGTRVYGFSGECPIHNRVHKGGAWKWELKQFKDYAGFKCWHGDRFEKFMSVPELQY